MIKGTAKGAKSHGVDSGPAKSAAVSSTLWRSLEAMLPGREAAKMGSATRHTLRRNVVGTTKKLFF